MVESDLILPGLDLLPRSRIPLTGDSTTWVVSLPQGRTVTLKGTSSRAPIEYDSAHVPRRSLYRPFGQDHISQLAKAPFKSTHPTIPVQGVGQTIGRNTRCRLTYLLSLGLTSHLRNLPKFVPSLSWGIFRGNPVVTRRT